MSAIKDKKEGSNDILDYLKIQIQGFWKTESVCLTILPTMTVYPFK